MIDEVWIVARKELIETMMNPKSRRQNLVGLGIGIAVVDLLPAFLIQKFWASIGIAFGLAMFSLIITPMMTTADSIAGERERHTLETLLATRLSDSAIVFGKILSLVMVSLASVLFILLQGIVVISALFGNWGPFPLLLLGVIAMALTGIVVSVFLCSIGVLVSMRAQTVQGAAQALAFVMMPIFVLPSLAMPLLGPDRFFLLLETLGEVPPISLGILVVAVVLGLDIALLTLVARAFRRPRIMRS